MNIDCATIIGWILLHKQRHDAFPGWPDEQIARTVLEHIRDNEMLALFTGQPERLIGVLLYSVNENNKSIKIQHILADSREAFEAFLAVWYNNYPGYALTGFRNGKERKYTTRNFQRLLRKNDTQYRVTVEEEPESKVSEFINN